jgi:hypothetical protein
MAENTLLSEALKASQIVKVGTMELDLSVPADLRTYESLQQGQNNQHVTVRPDEEKRKADQQAATTSKVEQPIEPKPRGLRSLFQKGSTG